MSSDSCASDLKHFESLSIDGLLFCILGAGQETAECSVAFPVLMLSILLAWREVSGQVSSCWQPCVALYYIVKLSMVDLLIVFC